MELFLRRVKFGYAPADRLAEEQMEAHRLGTLVRVETFEAQTGAARNRYYAILGIVIDNCEETITKKWLDNRVRIHVGHCKVIIDATTYEPSYTPKSLKPHLVDEVEMKQILKDAKTYLTERFLPEWAKHGVDLDEIAAEIYGF